MKLMILDGNSIVNRAFYGIRMLNAPDGTPTNGVYGFLTILHRLLEEEHPEYLCVAFDLHAPTFRHEEFADYKAQRKPMPEDLVVLMPILKELIDAAGIKRIELEGFEADDLIGTVSRRCEKEGLDCVIVTGDKDSFQLITDKTTVKHVKSRMGKTETIDYTPAVFREEYGFDPIRIIDLKALMGDASDNIPGVKGIGEKTAMSLIQSYDSIENIYADLDALDIKDSVRKKLSDGVEAAKSSYYLATIVTDVPYELNLSECLFSGSFNGAYSVFQRLGFTSLIEKWGLSQSGTTVPIMGQDMPSPQVIQVTSEDFAAAVDTIKNAEFVSVAPLFDTLDSIEVCDGEHVYIFHWSSLGDSYSGFLKLLFSQQIRKLSHNVKDFMGLLLSENLQIDGFFFDTAIAAYLLSPTESGYELSTLCQKYLGSSKNGSWAIYSLYPVLKAQLEEAGMLELLNNIEMPLCAVLADMEREGFCVDKTAIYDFGQQLSAGISALQKDIFALAGEEFNVNSPKQLGEILFEKLMLPGGKRTKTGFSTNADVLEKLSGKHEIVDKVLEFRQLSKLKSTYCDGLLKVTGKDNRIHTSFQMTVTATGRLSSTEPNLQNIPIRTPLGAELRKMFVAPKGSVLVDADYSQIELRLLAHISGDEVMQQAFLSGEDIHAVTASQVFGVPLSEVTKLQRSHAKAVNFGIVYGIGAFSLSQDIGVSVGEAKAYIDAYLEKYSGVRDYMEAVTKKAAEDGYAATLFGRRRPMPELKSSNHNLRAFGERVARNMPIQGTAADVIKLAMVNVHRRLKDEGLEGKLILQVHDELIALTLSASASGHSAISSSCT